MHATQLFYPYMMGVAMGVGVLGVAVAVDTEWIYKVAIVTKAKETVAFIMI